MRLFFKVLCVEPPQLLQLSADAKDTVRDVLARVQCGEPAEQLALVHEGKELTVSQSLDYAGVQDGATLHIICTRRTVRLLAKGQAADPSPAALTSPLSPGGAHRANIELARRSCEHRAAEAVASSIAAASAAAPRSITTSSWSLSSAHSISVPLLGSVVAATTPRSTILTRAGGAAMSATVDEPEPPSSSDEADELAEVPAEKRLPLPDPPRGALPPPTSWSDEPPDDCLQLDWAVGCSPAAGVAPCAGGREAVYAAGGLCVVHHPRAAAQRHFGGHSGGVVALAVHPEGRLVASAAARGGGGGGESGGGGGGEGEVLVWDTATCELLVNLRCELPPEAGGLSFDESGDTLACLSARQTMAWRAEAGHRSEAGVRQMVCTWLWRTGTAVATVALLAGGPCRALAWQPAVRPAAARLAVLGRHSLLLLSPPALEAAEIASFGRHGKPTGRLRALAALRNGLLVSGCSQGELQVWGTAQLLRRTQSHVGALRALAVRADGGFASGGTPPAKTAAPEAAALHPRGMAAALLHRGGNPVQSVICARRACEAAALGV